MTPLMIICKYNDECRDMDTMVKITELLLDKGAIVNIRDKTGYTPLMYACAYGNKEIVDLLIHTSSIDAADNSGSTVIILIKVHDRVNL